MQRKTMATPACPHCQGQVFELHEPQINGTHYKILFVQCAGCGAPVAAMEYYGSGAVLKEQEARIKNIEHQMSSISGAIAHISRIVTEMANQRSF
jgi:hypothetical protein